MNYLRLYPENFPEYKGEPNKESFEVKETEEIGKALYSKKDINIASEVFVFTGVVLPHITQWTLEISANLHIEDKYVMGFVAHSCDPNCYVDMARLKFIAIKPIKFGDKITMDYNQTETRLFSNFSCGCGTSKCRKSI